MATYEEIKASAEMEEALITCGRIWAATHPDATPEYIQKVAATKPRAWLTGVMHENWSPMYDENGKKLNFPVDL